MAQTLKPDPADRADLAGTTWIIDGTLIPLIPVHDQSITAISKNYRRSDNTQIIICTRRRVIVAGQCWPGNRNDVIDARRTVAHLLDGRVVLGDAGYSRHHVDHRPKRDQTGRIVHHQHYRAHRRITARSEHVIAKLKD